MEELNYQRILDQRQIFKKYLSYYDNKNRKKYRKLYGIKKLATTARKFFRKRKTVLFWKVCGQKLKSGEHMLMLAKYFSSKEVNVEYVICNGILSGCVVRRLENDNFKLKGLEDRWISQCGACCSHGNSLLSLYNISRHHISKWITVEKRAWARMQTEKLSINDIVNFSTNDIPIGFMSISGFLKYFQGMYSDDVYCAELPLFAQRVLREYFYSSLLDVEIAKNALNDIKPDFVFLEQPTYPKWMGMELCCLSRNIPVVGVGRGFKPRHFFIKHVNREDDFWVLHSDAAHWKSIKDKPLLDWQKKALNTYMVEQISLKRKNLAKTVKSPTSIRNELNLPANKPCWMINTSLMWDMYLLNEYGLFKSLSEWLEETCNFIKNQYNTNWIIRIHPADKQTSAKGKTCTTIVNGIFGKLPEHIRIIPHNNGLSTYSLFPIISGCVTMWSTVGFECVLYGKPSVVAGVPYYAHKGFTYDIKDKNEYFDILSNINKFPNPTLSQIELAERYAYDLFLYRQIFLGRNSQDPKTMEILYNCTVNKVAFGKHPDPGSIRKKEDWRRIIG